MSARRSDEFLRMKEIYYLGSMDRRQALRYTGWIAGTGLLAPGVFAALQSCRNAPETGSWTPQVLTEDQVNQLTTLADTIVPPTETPSASEVRVTEFVDLLMAEVLSDDQKKSIVGGLEELAQAGEKQAGAKFSDLTDDQRHELVQKIDDHAFGIESAEDYSASFLSGYRYLKSLILMAYYTSEEGVKQNLNYRPVPGTYHGCIELPEDGKIMVGNHI